MPSLEGCLANCGVNQNNLFTNLYIYSIFASQNLDFLASAAGRVDVEAARYLRMAQQMVRTRVDVLFRTTYFGTPGFGARFSFEPFGEINVATSEDGGQAFKADSGAILSDLEKFFAGATDWGESMKMDGLLFENLRWILKAEQAFYDADPMAIMTWADNDQEYIIEKLKMAAVTVQAHIYKGIELLRDKLLIQNGNEGKVICTSCGSQFRVMSLDDNGQPAPCPVCGAPPSMISEYKLKNSPLMDDIFNGIQ